MDKTSRRLYKLFIYAVLLALAVSIVVPVGWVFLASIKENSEFYGNPWAMPKGVYIQNFIDAFAEARMGDYFMNSVIVTALALLLLLVLALPAAYVLARYRFPGSKLCNVMFMGGLFINVNYIVVPIFLMFVDGDRWVLLKQPVYCGAGICSDGSALYHLSAVRFFHNHTEGL